MSDPVTLFPNILQPAAKTYAPVGVKFWEGEESLLKSMKEFADGWFERRRVGTEAALQTARRIGEAATPLDAWRAYQDWFGGAMARIVEDGMACQQQLIKANAGLIQQAPRPEPKREAEAAAESRLTA